jgi:hypothetical protein
MQPVTLGTRQQTTSLVTPCHVCANHCVLTLAAVTCQLPPHPVHFGDCDFTLRNILGSTHVALVPIHLSKLATSDGQRHPPASWPPTTTTSPSPGEGRSFWADGMCSLPRWSTCRRRWGRSHHKKVACWCRCNSSAGGICTGISKLLGQPDWVHNVCFTVLPKWCCPAAGGLGCGLA